MHEEAVHLRLGQRVGALLLDGVLGRHDHEERRQLVGRARHGDLPLLHGLEQRRLDLGRRAVDLVGQHDVGEDRPRLEDEAFGRLLAEVHLRAGDVGRQQVGGELDPAEVRLQVLAPGS